MAVELYALAESGKRIQRHSRRRICTLRAGSGLVGSRRTVAKGF
ncbi:MULTISPECIES: hypothetical protein [Candidatus Accumulibacter]|nr:MULTISPECIES: hypothetical protein [Candidatus Accumulibacter]HMW57810.1 hypothetical protein [Accumulibacter sp.]HNC20269.1 hypothetical protein [Accumulibacter sp.]